MLWNLFLPLTIVLDLCLTQGKLKVKDVCFPKYLNLAVDLCITLISETKIKGVGERAASSERGGGNTDRWVNRLGEG